MFSPCERVVLNTMAGLDGLQLCSPGVYGYLRWDSRATVRHVRSVVDLITSDRERSDCFCGLHGGDDNVDT